MSRFSCPLKEIDVPAFREYLIACSATMHEPTNEWEVLRFRIKGGGTGVLYRNAKGRATFTGAPLVWAWNRFRDGLEPREMERNAPKADPAPPEPSMERAPDHALHLFTDAGHFSPTKTGSWAAILLDKQAGENFEVAGALKGDVTSSTQAEISAVANGLHWFCKIGRIAAGQSVVVHCDNKAVVNKLNGFNRKSRGKSAQAVQLALHHVQTTAERCGVELTAQWVKGHQKIDSQEWRAAWNRKADLLCRKHLKAVNAKLREAGKSRSGGPAKASAPCVHAQPEAPLEAAPENSTKSDCGGAA